MAANGATSTVQTIARWVGVATPVTTADGGAVGASTRSAEWSDADPPRGEITALLVMWLSNAARYLMRVAATTRARTAVVTIQTAPARGLIPKSRDYSRPGRIEVDAGSDQIQCGRRRGACPYPRREVSTGASDQWRPLAELGTVPVR